MSDTRYQARCEEDRRNAKLYREAITWYRTHCSPGYHIPFHDLKSYRVFRTEYELKQCTFACSPMQRLRRFAMSSSEDIEYGRTPNDIPCGITRKEDAEFLNNMDPEELCVLISSWATHCTRHSKRYSYCISVPLDTIMNLISQSELYNMTNVLDALYMTIRNDDFNTLLGNIIDTRHFDYFRKLVPIYGDTMYRRMPSSRYDVWYQIIHEMGYFVPEKILENASTDNSLRLSGVYPSTSNIPLIKLILYYGADPTYRKNKILRRAARTGNAEIVELLLSIGGFDMHFVKSLTVTSLYGDRHRIRELCMSYIPKPLLTKCVRS